MLHIVKNVSIRTLLGHNSCTRDGQATSRYSPPQPLQLRFESQHHRAGFQEMARTVFTSILIFFCAYLLFSIFKSFESDFTNILKMAASKPKLNVQSFPRPPLLEKTPRHLQIRWDGELIADTTDAYWVLETHHPPSTPRHPPTDFIMILTLPCTHSILPAPFFTQSPPHQNTPPQLLRMERRRHLLGPQASYHR